GQTVRFVERGVFGIGIVLQNRSRQTVTVVDARTPEPPRSLVRQAGTRLVPWNPPPCPRFALGCPVTTFLSQAYGSARPLAAAVAPGTSVGVQLNYLLTTCAAARHGSTSSANVLDVAYRDGHGPI